MIDAALSSLPRRQTDGAVIVRSQDKDGAKAKAFKLNAQPRDPILIERFVLALRPLTLTDLVQGRKGDMSSNIDISALGARFPWRINPIRHQHQLGRSCTSSKGH